METKKKTKKEDNLIPIKKGERLNPNGRPKGQRNYATIYREALIKIGETKGMTPEEVEDELSRVGLDQALKGNPKFYQDVQDRVHGKPKQSIDMGVDANVDQNITVTFKKV